MWKNATEVDIVQSTFFSLLLYTSFIPLKNSNMKDSIPTKVYEALGIGCPVLLVAEGDSCDIVNESEMGRCVSPDHTEKLAEVFDEMVESYSTYSEHRTDTRPHQTEGQCQAQRSAAGF